VLLWYLGLFVTELLGGLVSGSIALRSEAVHVLSDAFSSLVSLAVVIALCHSESDNEGKIRGVGGIVSVVLLWAASYEICRESIWQLRHPTYLTAWVMFLFAAVGAGFNFFLHTRVMVHDHNSRSEEITNKFLDLHILLDMYQAIAVVVASVVIFATGWHQVDPILSIFVAAWMVLRTFPLVRQGFAVYRGQ
jgi:cobalt-zinc-cadmium efflux system protein